MVSFHSTLQLLRVQQWYKNSVVFIALLFSGNLFDIQLLFTSLPAFVALCLLSSANYIINDIKDVTKDRKHPLKRTRPIAAKIVSLSGAYKGIILLLLLSFGLSFYINLLFFFGALILFGLMQIYNFGLKKILYLDAVLIAFFFVIRAVLGALAISVWISPWLIICPFFLAIFLVASKRYSDLVLHPDIATETKKVLQKYTLQKAKNLLMLSVLWTLVSFIIYSFQRGPLFLFSVPFAGLALWRYTQLVLTNPDVGLQTELAIYDWKLVVASGAWFLIVLLLLY